MRPSETIFSDGLTPQKGRLKTQLTQLRRKRNNRRLPTDPIIRPPLFQTAQPCSSTPAKPKPCAISAARFSSLRRRQRQNPRHHRKNRLHDHAGRLQTAHHRRHHLHQQSRPRNAGARRQNAPAQPNAQPNARPHRLHLPLAGHAHTARRSPCGRFEKKTSPFSTPPTAAKSSAKSPAAAAANKSSPPNTKSPCGKTSCAPPSRFFRRPPTNGKNTPPAPTPPTRKPCTTTRPSTSTTSSACPPCSCKTTAKRANAGNTACATS